MGKIRVKLLGDESAEKEQKEQRKKEREGKKLTKTPGLKGGEKITVVEGGPILSEAQAEASLPDAQDKKGKKKKKKELKSISPRQKSNISLLNKGTTYSLPKAIEILKQFKKTKFDETVELHINLKEGSVSGQVNLPHGSGKKLRIKIADDKLIEEIASGKIEFDVLVATPAMMPKLAKVARVLGPRGLMPNPKAGTITSNPDEVIKKLSAGQVSYKSEAKFPLLHMSVGKTSFTEKQIEENVKAVFNSVGMLKIASITLKSTMSPAIKIQG